MPQNGSTWVRTTRCENTFTTAGAVRFTIGENDSRMVAASAGASRRSGGGRLAGCDLAHEAAPAARLSRQTSRMGLRKIGWD